MLRSSRTVHPELDQMPGVPAARKQPALALQPREPVRRRHGHATERRDLDVYALFAQSVAHPKDPLLTEGGVQWIARVPILLITDWEDCAPSLTQTTDRQVRAVTRAATGVWCFVALCQRSSSGSSRAMLPLGPKGRGRRGSRTKESGGRSSKGKSPHVSVQDRKPRRSRTRLNSD